MAIEFRCPNCGAATTVDQSYAGQTGPCASCGATITIPGGAPYQAQKPSGGGGATWVIVLAVCAALCLPCGGIGVALLLPAVQAAREAARRMECQNNLKQIALAMLNYEATHRTFPPAYLPDANGQPMHSWRVMILPYMEQQALYQRYDLNEPWDGPNNSLLIDSMPEVYACPSDPTGGCAYHVINVPDGIFDGAKANGMASIIDGTSNTILVVEAVGSMQDWTDPTNDLGPAALTQPVNSAKDGTAISSYHPGGAMIVRADGSVIFIPETTATQIISAMTTKSDGQAVQLP